MALALSNLCAWAPGISSSDEWQKWARGEMQIAHTKDAPKLLYTDMLFRRRLSQISKMTVEVVHNVIEKFPEAHDLKQVFISCRGELAREFQISKMLVEDHAILPAPFSLSVFNTPIALTTIALKLHAGSTAIYPSKENFCAAFQGAAAPILSGTEKKIILVYADELVPEEYNEIEPTMHEVLAFAAVLSNADNANKSIIETSTTENSKNYIIDDCTTVPKSAAEFLKLIIREEGLNTPHE